MKRITFLLVLVWLFCQQMAAQPKSAQMNCPTFSFPYQETFENYGDSDDVVRECWLHFGDNANYPAMSTFKACNSEHSAYFNSYNGNILSALQISGSYTMRNSELLLSAYAPATGSFLIVGVLTNPNMISTFVPLDTVRPQHVGRWERFRISFSHYTGSSQYLCFKSTGLNEIYVDDIALRAPTCELPMPSYENYESFALGTHDCWTNVTSNNSAVIDWDPIDTTVLLNFNYFYRFDSIYRQDSFYTTGSINQSFSYTGSYQVYNAMPGTYTLQVWGAEGGGQRLSGNSSSGYGGYGGYSTGTLTLTNSATLYIYSGGSGSYSTYGYASGGWNGGGSGYASSSGEPGNGGGGGSDIRINSTSLYARVIVAGGGGGGGEDSGDYYGHGGGTTGQGYSSYDAGQNYAGSNGSFGSGASTNYGDGGGGGGGWYGGGSSQSYYTGSDTQGGGGGSGYVYTSSTASNYPSGCLLNSNYYLTGAYTSAGNQSFPSTTGGTETGHKNNGYVKISGTTSVLDRIETVLDHIDTLVDHYTVDTFLTYYSHSLVIEPVGNPSIVVSPQIEDIEELQLASISFDIFSTENETVEVGMMTSRDNADAFYPFDNVQTQANTWKHVTCHGVSNDLFGNYLAFRSTGARPVYIDNLDFLDAAYPDPEEPIDTTGIREIDIRNASLTLAPNPAEDFITISAEKQSLPDAEVRLYNIFGTLVQTYTAGTAKINVAPLANGIYIIRIGDLKGKFIKH